MKIAIIFSKKDLASLNIKENLLELKKFKELDEFENEKVYSLDNTKLYTIDQDLIYAENIDDKIKADLFIFASMHKSESKIKNLTIHSIGNFGKRKFNEIDFGGRDKTLCKVNASMLKLMFLELNSLAKNSNYSVTIEATHHGPFLNKPAIFIEIGPSEEEWKDKKAGNIIANTIINAISKFKNQNYEITFGIGSTHYPSNFNKIMLNTNIAISYICAKYNLENLDKELILQAVNNAERNLDFILLDWKGLGKEKQRILKILEELNLEYKRTDKI